MTDTNFPQEAPAVPVEVANAAAEDLKSCVEAEQQDPAWTLDHYWTKRLLTPLSHADAMAEVWMEYHSSKSTIG